MEVCKVCGAFLIVGDAPARLDDHMQGKQHLGYQKLRTAVDEIIEGREKARQDRDVQRQRETDDRRGGSGRSRHDDDSSSRRDKDRGGSSTSSSRRHRSRSRSPHRSSSSRHRSDRDRSDKDRSDKDRDRSDRDRHRDRSDRHRDKDRGYGLFNSFTEISRERIIYFSFLDIAKIIGTKRGKTDREIKIVYLKKVNYFLAVLLLEFEK